MPRHYQPFVSQIRPTLATLPNFAAELTKPAASAVTLKYAQPDFVSQVRPTLAMLPRIVAGIAEPAPNALPQEFDRGSFVSPDKYGLVQAATPTIASWSATLGAKAIVLRYAQPDFVAQVRPTLATLPSPTAFLAYVSPSAQPQEFDRGSYVAPDKFGITVAAIPTIASWTATLGSIAQPQEFDKGSFISPDKTLPQVLATLANWTPTSGVTAQPVEYDRGGYVGPEKALPISIVSLAGWANSSDRWSAIKLRAALPDSYLAPVRILPYIENVTLDKWRQIEPPPVYRGRFQPSQTFTAPVMLIAPPLGPFVAVASGITITPTLSGSFAVRKGLSSSVTTNSSLAAKNFTIVAIL